MQNKNEKSVKILVIDEKKEIRDNLCRQLLESGNFDEVKSACNGEEGLEKTKQLKPDIVITDLVLSKMDGFALIENIKNINEEEKQPKIFVLSAVSGNNFVQKAFDLGVEYYMLKPFDSKALMQRLNECIKYTSPAITVEGLNTGRPAFLGRNKGKTRALEEKITNIFITVGIPAHIKGYQFLREAIKMSIEKPEIINSITKKLYPSIADRFDTSASKVERAIRHAIEVAWNRGKIENINSIFGVKVYSNNEKPTNGEFIALVADKMLLEGAY